MKDKKNKLSQGYHSAASEAEKDHAKVMQKGAERDSEGLPLMQGTVLTSQTVQVAATDSVGNTQLLWIHTAVLEQSPYFEAWRARWPSDKLEVKLHPDCTHTGLNILLERLYAKRQWHVLEWVEHGAKVALEVALQADMWGLQALASEATSALRTATVKEGIGKAVREMLKKIDVPPFLKIFNGEKPIAADMPDESIQEMLLSAANVCNEDVHRAVSEVLEIRRLYGNASWDQIRNVLKNQSLVQNSHVEEFETTIRSGKTFKNEEITRSFKSHVGFEWLCRLLQKHVTVLPEDFGNAVGTMMEAKREYLHTFCRHDSCSLASESKELIERQIVELLEIGASHVFAMRADESVFDKPEVSDTIFQIGFKGLSGSIIGALPENLQLALLPLKYSWGDCDPAINSCSIDRLQVLRGTASTVAAQRLARHVGRLSPDVLEYVMSELRKPVASEEEEESDAESPASTLKSLDLFGN